MSIKERESTPLFCGYAYVGPYLNTTHSRHIDNAVFCHNNRGECYCGEYSPSIKRFITTDHNNCPFAPREQEPKSIEVSAEKISDEEAMQGYNR